MMNFNENSSSDDDNEYDRHTMIPINCNQYDIHYTISSIKEQHHRYNYQEQQFNDGDLDSSMSSVNTESRLSTPAYLKCYYSNDSLASSTYHLDDSLASSTEYHPMSTASSSVSLSASLSSSVEYNNPSIEFTNENFNHLVALLHAAQCRSNYCKTLSQCVIMRNAFYHSKKCNNDYCDYNDCYKSRRVLKHFRNCINIDCSICLPARLCLMKRKNYQSRRRGNSFAIEERQDMRAGSPISEDI